MLIKDFDLTAIQENAFVYETHLKNVAKRRALWQAETKEKIKLTLEVIQKKFSSLNFIVRVNDFQKNHESVILKISDHPSGITEGSSKEGKARHYVQKGGVLGFSQMISGKISVWIEFPFVEDIQELEEPVNELGRIEPTYIAEFIIADYVTQFLNEIALFESKT